MITINKEDACYSKKELLAALGYRKNDDLHILVGNAYRAKTGEKINNNGRACYVPSQLCSCRACANNNGGCCALELNTGKKQCDTCENPCKVIEELRRGL